MKPPQVQPWEQPTSTSEKLKPPWTALKNKSVCRAKFAVFTDDVTLSLSLSLFKDKGFIAYCNIKFVLSDVKSQRLCKSFYLRSTHWCGLMYWHATPQSEQETPTGRCSKCSVAPTNSIDSFSPMSSNQWQTSANHATLTVHLAFPAKCSQSYIKCCVSMSYWVQCQQGINSM